MKEFKAKSILHGVNVHMFGVPHVRDTGVITVSLQDVVFIFSGINDGHE